MKLIVALCFAFLSVSFIILNSQLLLIPAVCSGVVLRINREMYHVSRVHDYADDVIERFVVNISLKGTNLEN